VCPRSWTCPPPSLRPRRMWYSEMIFAEMLAALAKRKEALKKSKREVQFVLYVAPD
jgi:hypothetical protein